MENEVWRWLWTCSAVVFSMAEIFTAGFFLLPFAIGAAVAAVLAWVDAHILWQWLAFFGTTLVSFVYLRRFVTRQNDDVQPRVGAYRLIDAHGMVIEPLDDNTYTGMVRIGGEEWRATSAEPIEVDTRIVVTDIDGTRLVVVPVPQDPAPKSPEAPTTEASSPEGP